MGGTSVRLVQLFPANRQRAVESDLPGFDGRLSMSLRRFIALSLELFGLSFVVNGLVASMSVLRRRCVRGNDKAVPAILMPAGLCVFPAYGNFLAVTYRGQALSGNSS